MSKVLTKDEVIELMRSYVTYDCSQRQLAKKIGVSEAMMCLVLKGERTSDKVFAYFGIERVTEVVVTYRLNGKAKR